MDVGEKRKRGRPRLTESTRKRRRQDNVKEMSSSRVYLGIHLSRWKALKLPMGWKTDGDVAKHLLDSYAGIIEADTRSKMTSTQLTSTPASASFIDVEKTPSVSAPESQIASSEVDILTSGLEELKSSEVSAADITIDITLQESDEEADDDPDFEPDFHMSSVLPENLQNFPDVTFEEAVFGQEEAAESDGEEAEVASPAVGQKKIVNEADIDALCSS